MDETRNNAADSLRLFRSNDDLRHDAEEKSPAFENGQDSCSEIDFSIYRFLFEFAEELFFILDEKCRIIHANDSATRTLGYSEKEMIGRDILFLHPPDRQDEAFYMMHEIIEGKRDFCSVPVISKTGVIIPAEHRVIRSTNYGKPVFLAISRDISREASSEAKFSKLFYSDVAMMTISNLSTGKFIEVNDAFLINLGFERNEVLGRNCDDLDLFMDRNQRNSGLKLLKKEGFIRNIEGEIRTKSGEVRCCVFSSDIIMVDGESHILMVIMDVTAHRNAENERLKAESRYRLLFEKSLDAVAILSGKPPKFILVNPAFEELVGYSSEEILSFSNEDMWRIVHPDDIPVVRARLSARFAGEDVPSRYEYRVVRCDGTIRWIEVSANVLNAAGEIFSLNIYRDVTERKNAEKLLKDAELRYRLLFENSIDAIAILGGTPPVFRQVNRAFTELFGFSSDEVLGFGAEEMWKLVHEDERETVKERLYSRFRGETPPSHYEFRIITGRCETRWVDVSTGVFDLGGDVFSQAIFRDVTERKISEKALLEREARLRAIFETTSAGILLVDTRGRVKTINRRMGELFACDPEELYALGYTDLVHPEDLEKGKKGLNDLISGKLERINTERHYLRLDGTDFWAVVSACRLLSPEGKLEGLLGVISDITEKKNAEDIIVEREAFLNAVIENLPFDMWAIDRDSRYILQNARSRKNWGDLTGKDPSSLADIVGAETVDLWKSNNQRAFSGEKITEEVSFSQDGRKSHFINALNPVRKKDDIIGVIGINIDITARKNAENIIKARLKIAEFADSHSVSEILRKALDEIEIITESSVGFFHFVSQIDRSLSLQAWSTNTLETMCSASPEQTHYAIEKAGIWAECIHLKKPVIHNDYESHPGKKGLPEGHARIIRELVVPVLSGDHVVAVIGVGNKASDYNENDIAMVSDLSRMIWDVVMRKRAEEERLELEKRLLHTQKLESLGVMAGGIAHDFNNLLMAILGNLEYAMMEIGEDSEVLKTLEQAMIASRRAADLTRQMLAYSGKGHFLISSISISDLVRENVEIFKTVISKSIGLKLELSDPLPKINADSGQIQQIVMNLITNASEAIGENSGTILIRTYVDWLDIEAIKKSRIDVAAGPGMFVCLEVRDTGCGMDRDTLNRIFDPFFTTKFTGRGLGMSAVLGIVKGHLGAVIVESDPGEGTAIRIFMPAAEGSFMLSGHPGASFEKIDHLDGKPKILIVDDEEMIRNICRRALIKKGYEVISASDGEEAVSVFEENSSDIGCVVLDLKMPKMDGITAFREMRKIKPDIKVILTSGYTENEASGLFSDEGLNGFIQKPYIIKELVEEISRCVE